MTHALFEAVASHDQPHATASDIDTLTQRAEAGDAQAQFRLAGRYEDAVGVPCSPERALRWYRAAARADLCEAQVALGTMLALGEGIEPDYAEAWVWFTRAADLGDVDAAELASLVGCKLDEDARLSVQRRAVAAA